MPHAIEVDVGGRICCCGATTVLVTETESGAAFAAKCPRCKVKYRITQEVMPMAVLKLHEVFHALGVLGAILNKQGE
jgi:phage FluMu protein Com